MKALSVKQPYAGMICLRKKLIETRTWSTSYRGDILICSSKTVHADYREDYKHVKPISEQSVYRQFGKALCVVNLIDCRQMVKEDEELSCCNIYPGAFSWVLRDIRRVNQFDVKGQMSLFEVDDSLIMYL